MNNKTINEIRCAYWDTPASVTEGLWLSNMLHTICRNYFFFENDFDSTTKFVYILTIQSGDAFKVSRESDSYIRITKLLKDRLPDDKKMERTYKIWNSPYALEASFRLGMTDEEYDKIEKFQYLIITQDECIEIVTDSLPTWEVYQEGNLEELVIERLKRDA